MISQTDVLAWITNHKACYELVPYFAMNDGKKIQIGFELDIFAELDPGMKMTPGCRDCIYIFNHLAEIVHLVLPTDVRPTRYDIQQFDASFHFRPEKRLKPEIQLTVLIVHRHDILDVVDECERRCAREIEDHLKTIGVQRKIWKQKINSSSGTSKTA